MTSMRTFTLRLSQSEVDALAAQADELGVPTNAYIRMALRPYTSGDASLSVTSNSLMSKPTVTKPAAAKPTAHKEVAPWKKPDIDVAAVVKDWGD